MNHRHAVGAVAVVALGAACSSPPPTFEEQTRAIACAVETSTDAFASTGAGLAANPDPSPSADPTTMCVKNVTCGPVDCIYDCGWGSHTLPLGPSGGQTGCGGGACAEFCAERCPATKDFPAPHGAGPMTCTLASTSPSPAPIASCEEAIVPWANCRTKYTCKRIIVERCQDGGCPNTGIHTHTIDCSKIKGGCSHADQADCTRSLPACDKTKCDCQDSGRCH